MFALLWGGSLQSTNAIWKRQSKAKKHTIACASDAIKLIAANQENASTRPPRFYIQPPIVKSSGASYLLEAEEARHAVKALRLKEGDRVELCDGQGTTVLCELTSIDKGFGKAWAQPVADPVQQPWLGPTWVVAVACTTLKGGRAEWLVEKCTELGAREFIPLITERSQAGGKNKFRTRADANDDYQPGRLERVAIAATKQSLRSHGLKLHPPTKLQDMLPMLDSTLSLVATAGAPPLWQALQQPQVVQAAAHREEESTAEPSKGLLFIGPEGDFTPSELEMLIAAGAQPVGLGPNRLRTETAAIAMLAAACLYR